MKAKRKWWIIPLVVAVLAVIGYYAYPLIRNRFFTSQTTSSLTTVKVAKTNLSTYVGATGTVRTTQNSIVTWQTSGKVQTINVKVGDKVQADQVLASLDPASLPSSVILAQADLQTAQQALDTLMNSKVNIATAEQAVANAQQTYDDAKTKYEGLAYPRGTPTDIENAYTQMQYAQAKLADAQTAYNAVQSLPSWYSEKISALNNLTQAQQRLYSTSATWQWLRGRPTPNDMALAKSAMDLAEAQLKEAQRQYDLVKNGPTDADIAAAKAKIQAAQNTLDMVNVVSPINGTITEVDIIPGDTVSPGTTAFRVDDVTNLYVDLQVSEIDINSVQVGQAVELSYDAIPDKTYKGVVTEIGVIGTSANNVVNYPVTVKLTDPDSKVKTGMTTGANIVVSTIANVLAVPPKAIRSVNNVNLVYLVINGNTRPVRVTVGASSDTLTQVTSNQLKEGDAVLANASTVTTTTTANRGFFLGGGGVRVPAGGGNFRGPGD